MQELDCRELVDRITDYLEGELTPEQRVRWNRHLDGCEGCQIRLREMRLVVRALRGLSGEPVAPAVEASLLDLFRESSTVRLGLALEDDVAAPGSHVAYFYENDSDFEAALGFLEIGLRGRDACVVFGHQKANERVLALLEHRGFDVSALVENCRLSVLGGGPSATAMLTDIAAAFESSPATGAPLLRLLGNIGWGRAEWPDDDEILEFEARVTEAARKFPSVIVCMYDVRSLAGRIVLKGGFQTHPLTVCSGMLSRNPQFVSTERFLGELRGPRH